MTLAEALEVAVRGEDLVAIRELVGGLPEAERTPLQPYARDLMTAEIKLGIERVRHLGPMLLVAYGTLPVTDLRKLGWRSLHAPEGMESVLRRRSPERLGPIVDHLLDVGSGRAWRAVRALVREGIISRPASDAYTIGMLVATRYGGVAAAVEEDPGLLDDEVWRLFEVEGGGETSLSAHEKYTGDAWGDLFRDLASRDPALRSRLLDVSLAALGRDFATFRAGWFSRFHESLAPSDDERAERVDSYLGLLRSRSGPTVSFAVLALGRISRVGRLPPDLVLGHLDVVLMDAPAGTARSALELVARAGGDPSHAHEAALVATAALAHASTDVQRAAVRLIGDLITTPDASIAMAVADRLPQVAASQRSAAMGLMERLGHAAADPPPAAASPRPAATPVQMAVPTPAVRPSPLDPARAIAALTSIDDLIDVAVSVVETGEPAGDLERVLDAVGRFGAERPDGFGRLVAALARRARTILGRRESAPFNGFDARADAAAVLLAWTTGELRGPSPGYRGIDPGAGAFLSARAREVAEVIARQEAFRGASVPTHAGGFIDPLVLVERLTAQAPASHLDLVAAILRLAPERRAEALGAATVVPGEVGAVVRYALGGDEQVGPTAAWWVAAARVRAPGRDDERVEARHPRLGPDAGLAARLAILEARPGMLSGSHVVSAEPVPDRPTAADLPTVLMLRGMSSFAWTGRSDPAMLRWIATIQPGYREAWATKGAATLASNVDWWSAEWADRVFLEPFTDPVTDLGPQARRMVAIALGAREAGERGLAADIVRMALADGRLTAAGLSEGLAAAAALGCDRPMRWAASLGDVAGATPEHASAVADAISATLPSLVARPPGSLVPWLRLLDELLAETGSVAAPEGRGTLAALAARQGQAGRLARSALTRSSVTGS